MAHVPVGSPANKIDGGDEQCVDDDPLGRYGRLRRCLLMLADGAGQLEIEETDETQRDDVSADEGTERTLAGRGRGAHVMVNQ